MPVAMASKPLPMANVFLTSLPPALSAAKAPHHFLLPLSAKPLSKPLLHLSLSSSPLQKKSPCFTTFVVKTDNWARQDEGEVEWGEGDEEEGEPRETEGPEAGLVDWDGEAWSEEGMAEAEEREEDGAGEEVFPEPPEEAKLFVGNIPYDMDSERLANLFDGAGVVEVAEVIYDRNTQKSRGFGFVTMSTVEEAEKAVEMFNRYDVNGRILTVNKAAPRGTRPERQDFAPSFRIYVGNLPWQVDDACLEQLFSEHGKVIESRVVCERETGRSRGFGFVKMATKTEMDDAIVALDGQDFDGRALRVNVAEERPRRSFV